MRSSSAGETAPGRTAGRRALLRLFGTLASGSALVTLVSCASAGPDATRTATDTPTQIPSDLHIVFQLDFDGSDPLQSLPRGGASVTKETVFGGDLELVDSHPGGRRAAHFPAFVDSTEQPGVGLVAVAAAKSLPDPGIAVFGFGATIMFDDPGAASDSDNGDNVIQRGLAADPAQFKLQADHGVPSCSVTGSAGRVLVKGKPLEADSWYRLVCMRSAAGLELTVTDLTDDRSAVFRGSGTTGTVDFDGDVPLAIGRKVGANGIMVSHQPDQFNGTMDSVWVGIASG